MVELIAISAVVLVGVFAVFLGTPRYVGNDGSWPDVFGRLDGIANRWLEQSRFLDILVGIVAVVLLGLAVSMFRGGDLLEGPIALAWALLLGGLIGVFTATYINVRRSDLSSAEATLIGGVLVGIVLLVAVVGVLLDI